MIKFWMKYILLQYVKTFYNDYKYCKKSHNLFTFCEFNDKINIINNFLSYKVRRTEYEGKSI